jgi:hypothetical protein
MLIYKQQCHVMMQITSADWPFLLQKSEALQRWWQHIHSLIISQA